MAEEYNYLFKCILIGDKGVGQTTLAIYLDQLKIKATKERDDATKKQYDKEIDEYHILRDKAKNKASKRVLTKWIKSLTKQKTALDKYYNYRLTTPTFNSHRLTTGVDHYITTVELRGNNAQLQIRAKLQIWILSPLEHFNSIREMYVRNSLGAIIMYDITNINSVTRISKWCQLIREKNGNIPILLVGNKLDLEPLREISVDHANQIKEQLQLSALMEISSKTGENVELMLERFTQLIIDFSENRN